MFETHREFLKAHVWKLWQQTQSDQQRGLPIPPVQKAVPAGARIVDLVAPGEMVSGEMPVREAIARRQTRRKYSADALSLEELSFLLWATQGVRESMKDGTITKRTVPSGGSRQPFETYLMINRVADVERGLYRYLPLQHKLMFVHMENGLAAKLADACHRQGFVADAAVIFFWTAIPYRTEWRYTVTSHKVIAIDAGHVCQNLYTAAESIGAGCCAIAAYDQDAVDALLGVDGQEEFCIYLAPVGRQ